MERRQLLAAMTLGAIGVRARAQALPYPSRPVRVVIGFAPGGAADTVARAMSEPFGRAMGQPIVVENKPGNGSSLAAGLVAKAPPDGYTLLIGSPSNIIVNPSMNPKVGYTRAELVPVTKITTSPLVLAVHAQSGVTSIPELIELARRTPGGLNFASSGNGSAPHLGAALFAQVTGMPITNVPYRGGALAIQSVMAGETQATFGTSPSVLPQVKGGRLRALAVSTRERSALVPDVPGMREAGLPDYQLEFWYGVFVPAGTPREVVAKVYDASVAAMREEPVKAALARDGTEVSVSPSPEAFARFLEEDSRFWIDLVKRANVKID